MYSAWWVAGNLHCYRVAVNVVQCSVNISTRRKFTTINLSFLMQFKDVYITYVHLFY
jgi:hypothetical protein